MFENYKDILTPAGAAEALGICKNSIYEFLKNGTIASIRVGKKIIIPKIYLMGFINTYRNKTVTNSEQDDY